MPLFPRSLRSLVVAAALACLAVPAFAVDTPTLDVSGASRTSLTLEVAAGESGAPSGFTVEWMLGTDFDLLGGFPTEVGSPVVRSVRFVGSPTLNTVDGTRSYLLGANGRATVEVGDLFDETGVIDGLREELQSGTEYVVRVLANGTRPGDGSEPSSVFRVSTQSTSSQNCTYTQGYWKNHASAWPVTSVTLGSVTYTQAQLLAIFSQPAAGNGLISLAHQLIAAKLNLAQGAVPTAAVTAAIASADALIGALVVPPVGSGSLAPSTTSGLTNTLDQFNNGATGPGHCGSTPNAAPTWGSIKLLYR